MESISDTFKAEVEQFLVDSKMTPTAFGLAAVNDPSFIGRLRGGRNFRLDTVERVKRFMREQRAAA